MTDISEMREIDLAEECPILFCPSQRGVDGLCDICHEHGYITKTTPYIAQTKRQPQGISESALERIISETTMGAISIAILTIIIFSIRALNKYKYAIFSTAKKFFCSMWDKRANIQQIIIIISLIIISISLIIISICLIKIAF